MKLQRHKTRKNEEYYKYVLVLSNNLIEESGFHEGDELEGEAKKGEIKIKKKLN